jgi:hypothetical protein
MYNQSYARVYISSSDAHGPFPTIMWLYRIMFKFNIVSETYLDYHNHSNNIKNDRDQRWVDDKRDLGETGDERRKHDGRARDRMSRAPGTFFFFATLTFLLVLEQQRKGSKSPESTLPRYHHHLHSKQPTTLTLTEEQVTWHSCHVNNKYVSF